MIENSQNRGIQVYLFFLCYLLLAIIGAIALFVSTIISYRTAALLASYTGIIGLIAGLVGSGFQLDDALKSKPFQGRRFPLDPANKLLLATILVFATGLFLVILGFTVAFVNKLLWGSGGIVATALFVLAGFILPIVLLLAFLTLREFGSKKT